MDSVTPTAVKIRGKASPAVFQTVIHIVAFVTGGIVMTFQMLRSRYLNPLFLERQQYLGSADLDSAGGADSGLFPQWLQPDRRASAAMFGMILDVASVCLLALPSFANLWRDAIGTGSGLLLALDRAHLPKNRVRPTAGLVGFAVLALASSRVSADDLIDENVRAQMLKHSDGQVARLETEYNDLFIDKRGSLLGLSSTYKRYDYIESIIDLKDPDAMTLLYTRIMPVALAYPQETKRILMMGLGAGSISTYLGRAMPDTQIDVVELDPGVIAAGKKYFGLRETDKVRFIESDGRVYLNRHKDTYDLILLDAFRERGVPFHMLTREFYALLKEHLAPGGAAASNVVANTKLYLSTLVTLRAVFPTVDVYPAWGEPNSPQAIAVAVSGPRPATESLMQRARALQTEYHFRYPLPALVGKRVTELHLKGADVLTDDFAPADLYRVTPLRGPQR
jgi:spermidine synthase